MLAQSLNWQDQVTIDWVLKNKAIQLDGVSNT